MTVGVRIGAAHATSNEASQPARSARALVIAAAVLAQLAGVAALGAQGMGARTLSGYRIEAGLAASTPIVEDGNGVAVRRGVGPYLSGDAIWSVAERTTIAASLRGSSARLHMRSMERRWSGGTAHQFDFALRAERGVMPSLTLGAGLVGSLLRGPRDVIPFRSGQGFLYAWGSELSAAARLSRARRLDAVFAADAVRISPPNSEAWLVGGWIGRVRLGIRHAL